MCSWSEEEARAFFESGGEIEPGAAVAADDAHAPVMEQNEDSEVAAWSSEVSIGGITLPVETDRQAPELVPWVGENDALPFGLSSQGSLSTLRWLMMQLALGQDMMLLTDPGPRARRLGAWLCALLGREARRLLPRGCTLACLPASLTAGHARLPASLTACKLDCRPSPTAKSHACRAHLSHPLLIVGVVSRRSQPTSRFCEAPFPACAPLCRSSMLASLVIRPSQT